MTAEPRHVRRRSPREVGAGETTDRRSGGAVVVDRPVVGWFDDVVQPQRDEPGLDLTHGEAARREQLSRQPVQESGLVGIRLAPPVVPRRDRLTTGGATEQLQDDRPPDVGVTVTPGTAHAPDPRTAAATALQDDVAPLGDHQFGPAGRPARHRGDRRPIDLGEVCRHRDRSLLADAAGASTFHRPHQAD